LVESVTNAFGQPIGCTMPEWSTRPFPPRKPLYGRWCRLEPLANHHARGLFEADQSSADDADWTYLAEEPFRHLADYESWTPRAIAQADPQFFAIIDTARSGATGRAAFMRIDPVNGVIEIGHVKFSSLLQRTRAATEALFLMMHRVFDELGYRRLEWKCDAMNAPSRTAAERLGFRFEGIFRQAVVVKGRNRDTAWYSIIDTEWPALRAAFEAWLPPENFAADGRQVQPDGELVAAHRRS
jgi:RimJ/RimL family protein N-acetyltransferase